MIFGGVAGYFATVHLPSGLLHPTSLKSKSELFGDAAPFLVSAKNVLVGGKGVVSGESKETLFKAMLSPIGQGTDRLMMLQSGEIDILVTHDNPLGIPPGYSSLSSDAAHGRDHC